MFKWIKRQYKKPPVLIEIRDASGVGINQYAPDVWRRIEPHYKALAQAGAINYRKII